MRFLMFLSFPFFFFGGLMVLKGAPLLVQLQALTQREHVKLTQRSNIDEQRLCRILAFLAHILAAWLSLFPMTTITLNDWYTMRASKGLKAGVKR